MKQLPDLLTGFSWDEVENELRIQGTQVCINITYSAELFKHK